MSQNPTKRNKDTKEVPEFAARAAKELRRGRTWASDWLARYDKEVLMDSKINLKLADHLNFLKKLPLG